MITQITMDAMYVPNVYAKDIAPNPSLSSLTYTRLLLPHCSVPLLSRPQNGLLSVSTRLGSESTGFPLLTDWLGLESDVYSSNILPMAQMHIYVCATCPAAIHIQSLSRRPVFYTSIFYHTWRRVVFLF